MGRKEELARRLDFLGITAAETGRLRGLRPLLARSSDALVADFYRHLLSFPETRRLLRDSERRERLLGNQRAYLLSLASAALDEEYVEERRRIGEMHEEVGLPPGWYLGAYAQYFSLLAFLIEDAVEGDVEEFRLLLVALLRRTLLDAQLSIEAYVEQHERRLEYLNEELAQSQQELGREFEEQRAHLRHVAQRARTAEAGSSPISRANGPVHEMGRSLQRILGHAEALEGDPLDEPKVRERGRLIREQVSRLAKLVRGSGAP